MNTTLLDRVGSGLRVGILATGIVATAGLAAGAEAATVTGSFSGVIAADDPLAFDATGVFGIPGSLAGATVSGVYAIDLSQFAVSTNATTATATQVGSGPNALTVTLTINADSYTFHALGGALLQLDSGPVNDFSIYIGNSDWSGSVANSDAFSLDVTSSGTPFLSGTDFVQAFSAGPGLGSGLFSVNVVDGATNPSASASSLQFTSVTQVPEPAFASLLGAMALVLARSGRRRAV